MSIPAYPLQWPTGWKRTEAKQRKRANFRSGKSGWDNGRFKSASEVTIAEGTRRVLREISAFTPPGKRWVIDPDTLVISTNLQLRNDGLPRSGQREPEDPGVAVYWTTSTGETRCMAIDRYDRIADNLAAIAATLDAMRAIERHGGAEILNRAFTGFTALPGAGATMHWRDVLGVPATATRDEIEAAYRRLRSQHHPDRGGDAGRFHQIQKAFEEATTA
ncbi:MAG TPA: J domain-containing protein [Frateuria sp.]|uniref:J domain-containing protein n=1 Tax=Frateuria sp. TaxID=2211372 RepID=UPI002DE4E87A|nr:J domain-containing protein [Frateuria sp.]